MSTLELLGGALCLDFANTVDRTRAGRQRHEYLRSFASLVDWARHVRIVDDQTAGTIRLTASRKPESALNALNQALDLRRVIQGVFAEVAESQQPAQRELERLRCWYRNALDETQLERNGSLFEFRVEIDPERLHSILWPVVISAIDLLRAPGLDRVRRCPGDEGRCGWLFLDTTRNRSRRWCSMRTCGSRDKMRRLYRRQRES